MKKTILTDTEIKEIIKLYTNKEISSTHKLGKQFKVTHKEINSILTKNGVEINSRGGQKINDKLITESTYLSTENYVAICKSTNKMFNDYTNISGCLTNHIKKHFPSVIIPNSYTRRKYFQSTGKYWHELFFDIVTKEKSLTKKCGYCDWETVDIENKSGSYSNHLKNSYNKTTEEHIIDFREDIDYFKTLKQKNDRNKLFTDNNEYVVCQICGKKMKHVNNKHLQTHNITPDVYKLQHGVNSLMSNNLSILTSKRLNQYNIDYSFHKDSKEENVIKEIIKNCGFNVIENDRKVLDGKEIDILIPEMNLGFEYNGNKFHTEYYGQKYPNYHLDKLKLANYKGFGLVQIFEDEWELNKDLLTHKIKHILGVSSGLRVGARKCIIKEIITNDKNNFLDKYHIQGSDTSTIKYGAYYGDELIAVMTFRTITTVEYELTRFATNYGYIIPGIASRLLKRFIKDYKPLRIISFADRRWTIKKDDNLYTKLNFKLIDTTKPDYKYYNTKIHRYKRVHKFQFRKKNLINKYDMNPELTEKEMTKILGYDRIWDCGLFKYELIITI